jgi:hypothetical protein
MCATERALRGGWSGLAGRSVSPTTPVAYVSECDTQPALRHSGGRPLNVWNARSGRRRVPLVGKGVALVGKEGDSTPYQQDYVAWRSVNRQAHRHRRGRFRSCWPSSGTLATPTSATHAAQWGSPSVRLPASSLATRRRRSLASYKMQSSPGAPRLLSRRGGCLPRSRCSVTCLPTSSPPSFVVAVGPPPSPKPRRRGTVEQPNGLVRLPSGQLHYRRRSGHGLTSLERLVR